MQNISLKPHISLKFGGYYQYHPSAKAPFLGGGGICVPRAVYYTTRRIAQADLSVNGSGVLSGWQRVAKTSVWLSLSVDCPAVRAGDGHRIAGSLGNAAGCKPAVIYVAQATRVA